MLEVPVTRIQQVLTGQPDSWRVRGALPFRKSANLQIVEREHVALHLRVAIDSPSVVRRTRLSENESRHSCRHTDSAPAKAGVGAGAGLAKKRMIQQLRRVMAVQAVLHEPFSMAIPC